MHPSKFNLMLADDDHDDCIFFKEALEELQVQAKLKILNDGVKLMTLLSKPDIILPDALYLDLNMPRKNGFECVIEIKQMEKLKSIPVIIFSTSFDPNVVDILYEQGATYYMQKPAMFSNLKNIIAKSLQLISIPTIQKPLKENFVITSH